MTPDDRHPDGPLSRAALYNRRGLTDRRDDRRKPRPGRRLSDLAPQAGGWLLVPTIAEYLNIEARIVERWIDAGLLPGDNIDGRRRVSRADLEGFVERKVVSSSTAVSEG